MLANALRRLSFGSIFSALLFTSTTSQALPIGFGRAQGELEFKEITTPNYAVYFDKRTQREGQAITNALESGGPILESWLNIKRTNQLPVIISSTTSNASFANFITDALELQTLGQGGRDLAWHELTHNIMYRHLDNWFGPVGNILHLPWMPAWWLEGLAEATSMSIGSDNIYSIEREAALTGAWPSYAKLHSLYSTSFAYEGYGISGAFVSYILRTYGADSLNQLFDDFFSYTMPWWWPWSFIPFNDFMPFDQALKNMTGKTGEELYEEYKKAAELGWKKKNLGSSLDQIVQSESQPIKETFTQLPHHAGQAGIRTLGSALQARNHELFTVVDHDGELYESKAIFPKDSPKQQLEYIKHEAMPDDALNVRVAYGPLKVFISAKMNAERERINTFSIYQGGKSHKKFYRRGFIKNLFMSSKNLVWLENIREITRLCSINRQTLTHSRKVKKDDIHCLMKNRYPSSIEFLGERFSKGYQSVESIVIKKKIETMLGDQYQIFSIDLNTLRPERLPNPLHGRPLSYTFFDHHQYLLLSSHNKQFIRKFDQKGRCIHELISPDHLTKILANESHFYVVTRKSQGSIVFKGLPQHMLARSCAPSREPSSPMMVAQQYPGTSFTEALRKLDPWQERDYIAVAAIQKEAPLHRSTKRKSQVKDAQWRGRPVFAFPWIGADSDGYQLGILSIPLMDHLQNETVFLSTLYGVNSNFPGLQLDFSSTRYSVFWKLSAYRRQSWNGLVSTRNDAGETRSSTYYFDERGAELSASYRSHSTGISSRFSIAAIDKLPYRGQTEVWDILAHGYATELTGSLSKSFRLGNTSLNLSTAGKVAPEQINSNFKYNKLTFSTNYQVPISIFNMQTRQILGLSYGRTRGKRRPYLREVYRPLKTFVPGSGGGFNEINIGLLGPGALTSAKYGDTQARLNWAWTFPLVKHLETLIHIFYLERLDFTAFFNYGNAWSQNIKPHPRDFIKAHGYNLDLQSDIKGVTVNLGLGTGQVLNNDWEVYFLFGFDALIDP